jgi:uncharacterized damage-inducible protein DinB
VQKDALTTLLDYLYWQTYRVLAAAARVPTERFTDNNAIGTRTLRGALVHALDVELSWRLRLQGEPKSRWDEMLRDEDYPTVASLAEHWKRDEKDMRAWLRSLDDTALVRTMDLGGDNRYPLWHYVLHLIMHGFQQRSEAAVLTTHYGESPGDLDFLDYADWKRNAASPSEAGAIAGS